MESGCREFVTLNKLSNLTSLSQPSCLIVHEVNNAVPQFLGFGISAARLGLPDTGFISYGEMVDQGQQITGAVSIPIIGDGDNGYGNPMNVKRTVRGYIRAGFAGIILEDQVYTLPLVNFCKNILLEVFSLRSIICEVY